MANFNWVDYSLSGIFMLCILMGFAQGFVKKIISLASLVAGFVIASTFASTLANAILNYPTIQTWFNQLSNSVGSTAAQTVTYLAIGLSFSILFGMTLLVGSIVGFIVGGAFQFGILGLGNRILGAFFGLVQGFLISLVIIFVVQLTPLSNEMWWTQSVLVSAFQPAVQWLGNLVSPALANLKMQFDQTWQTVNTGVQRIGF